MEEMETGIPFANFSRVYETELMKLIEPLTGKVQLPDESEFHSSMTSSPLFTGVYGEGKVQISINIETGVTFLEIAFLFPFGFKLALAKESFASRIGKGLGLEHEIVLDDDARIKQFDREFLVKGTPEDKIRKFLEHQHSVEAIGALGDFEKLTTTENHIAVWYLVDSEDDLGADKLLDRVKLLHQLSGYAG